MGLFHPIHQLSYSLQMYNRYILTTTRFPLVYLNDPLCNYYIEHTPGKQDHITVDILFQLNYLNRIHTKEFDLLEFKQNSNLPPWYPVFKIPYNMEIKVSYTEYSAFVQLIYVDTSTDVENYPPGV